MTLRSPQAAAPLTGVAAEAAQMAIEAGLVYVSDAEPGIRRLRAGKGFRYLTPENRRLAAAKELKRIASLPRRVDFHGSARPSAGDRTRCARPQAIPLSS